MGKEGSRRRGLVAGATEGAGIAGWMSTSQWVQRGWSALSCGGGRRTRRRPAKPQSSVEKQPLVPHACARHEPSVTAVRRIELNGGYRGAWHTVRLRGVGFGATRFVMKIWTMVHGGARSLLLWQFSRSE